MFRRNRVEDVQSLVPDDTTDTEKGKFGTPKKYDPQFKGPIKNRSCTDVICCIFFLACIGGLGFVAYLAWTSGDPTSLLYPTDYKGRVCGRDEGVENKSLLFYFDYMSCANLNTLLEFSCQTPQVCVHECPSGVYLPYAELMSPAQPLEDPLDWFNLICIDDFDPEFEFTEGDYNGKTGLFRMFDEAKCAYYYLPQSAYAKRCIPSFLLNVTSSVQSMIQSQGLHINDTSKGDQDAIESSLQGVLSVIVGLQDIVNVVFEDLLSSWTFIIAGLFLGMLLAMIYIILMRWIAGIIVWFTIITLYATLTAGSSYCFFYWHSLKNIEGSDGALSFDSSFTSNLKLRTTWLIFGCILGAIMIILLVITICLCKRIRIAIALIKEASRAVGYMFSTLYWPIIPFILEVLVVTLWLAISVYLATSHSAVYQWVDTNNSYSANITAAERMCTENETRISDLSNTTSRCQFISYSLPEYTIYLQFFNLFMFFWLANFVIALGQMTLAGAFASYYWAFTKPQDIPSCPVFSSCMRAIRYHLGSLAFGSLIIAIIQIVRVVLEYIEQKLKGKASNNIIKYIIKCLACAFWLLEKIMKFINKNAYIMIAIYGKNFCTSAKEAFCLLMRNIVRVAVVNKLTDFIILLGKLSVTAMIGVFSYFVFSNKVPFLSDYIVAPTVTHVWTPTAVITLGTFAIAWCFFNVYDMAVDTLFLCFLEDLERHDGSAEKPYYMSRQLKNIVGKKNV